MSLFGGSLHPNFEDNQYIEYAKNIPLVKIIVNNKFCSGILINENYILTVKHTIEYHNFFEIYFNDTKLDTQEVVYNSKEDLCLIRISNKMTSYIKNFYHDVSLINKKCCISGYGIRYCPKINQIKSNDLIKRAGNNIIVWETDSYFECKMDKEGIELEFIPTIGDSGGPVLIDEQLVGINKYVKALDGNADSGYDDISGHIKIYKYRGWISQNIKY